MYKKNLLLFVLFFVFLQLTAQQKLSPKATVSVITCGPGDELYTAFGHSAFRIYDPILSVDKVYNYGTFDFNAPNFYLNFAKGKLTYQLSTSSFNRFIRIYKYENRWVKAQELNLTIVDVQKVYAFLENNAKPQNKYYRYDFFYNNCATKIEDIIQQVLKNKVTFSYNYINSNKTHRDLIADYTHNFKWAKFGIDLALGSVIDKKATKKEYNFLPDYIFKTFKNAVITNEKNQITPLVKKTSTVISSKKIKAPYRLFSPFNVLLLLSLLIIFVTYRNYKSKRRTKFIDFALYFSTGIIGVIVLLLWFATSHTATYKNLNFLWAFAPNLIVSFIVLKNKLPKWIFIYNRILLVLITLTFIVWILKIQIFNLAIIPFLLALIIRYEYLIKNRKLTS
ncbi:lipoprotein N-acyltransferase Lnb domain-containing protein [Lutibacter sp.]